MTFHIIDMASTHGIDITVRDKHSRLEERPMDNGLIQNPKLEFIETTRSLAEDPRRRGSRVLL